MRFLSFCTWLAVGLIGLSSCQDIEKPRIQLRNDSTSLYYEDVLKPFYHGVASGDPLSDRVIIWTRITPEYQMPLVNVAWEVATDQTFSDIVNKGTVKTDSTKDYTIKVDVTELQPASTYYYRFSGLGGTSLVGRTKTLPTSNPEQLKLAIVSCSNFEAGYFNAFGRIAEIEDLDVVVHLGDYIYEYETGKYGDESLDRKHLPSHEIVTLSDYRTRYAQYRLDPDLRKVHQNHPFITIWDDHEIANNAFMDGAQNHQENQEGSYLTRKKAAVQTYFEWLPIRELNADKIYRTFSFGDLAELVMLDGRLEGRVAPVDSMSHPEYWEEDRTMISQQQMEWLMERLTKSPARWKIIGNPVIFSDLDVNPIWGSGKRNLDSWDGYPAQKKMISDQLGQQQVKNVLIVTGDTHTSMAFECIANALDDKETSPAFAVEFATPSISSSNPGTYDPPEVILQREDEAYRVNPHLKYVNLTDHGYLILQIEPQVARAEWHYVDRVDSISNQVSLGKSFTIKSGTYKLLESE